MHRSSRNRRLAIGAAIALAFAVAPAFAKGTQVHVDLWDKGSDMQMMTGLGYGMPGADKSKATMGLKLSGDSAPAGEITFDVTNTSKDYVHEMIVSPLPPEGKQLPYVADENRVDEQAAGHLGEVEELDPGASGSLTILLKAGKYILYCNIPGHYTNGMWTEFTVK